MSTKRVIPAGFPWHVPRQKHGERDKRVTIVLERALIKALAERALEEKMAWGVKRLSSTNLLHTYALQADPALREKYNKYKQDHRHERTTGGTTD